MATRTVKVSDISGQVIEDERGARLIVEHPDFSEPIGLDVLSDEVLPHLTDERTRFVVVSLEDPGNPNPERYGMSFDDFERLFQTGDSASVLQDAHQTQQQEREAEKPRRGRGKRGVSSGTSGTRARIDYSSPEHAGEPHRGTISDAERTYVQEHLDEVNERLRQKGMREIDPFDLRMIELYGLTPPEL